MVLHSQLIIAAVSSRIYVQAAIEAGFEVIAIDAFADVDTQALASKVFEVPMIDGQFDAAKLLSVLHQLDLSNCLGLCYGAGFEAQPELLASIQKIIPLIGNTALVVEQIKNPVNFFGLCDALSMAYPETQFERPKQTNNWLQKKIGGSGGAHIKRLLPLHLPSKHNDYYQKNQTGMPVSCLFLADGKNVQVIGFNEQWCSPTALLPYRYAGAVSQLTLEDTLKNKLETFIKGITAKLGLLGLNSCDCIVESDSVFMLEINPRLSATLGLYRAKKGCLFAAHVAACLGHLKQWPTVDKQSRAHHIIYANKTAHVPLDMDWPDWVCDIPQPNSAIAAGAPLCTVAADARTAKFAKQKVLQRAAELHD